jgi:hypothetical protein
MEYLVTCVGNGSGDDENEMFDTTALCADLAHSVLVSYDGLGKRAQRFLSSWSRPTGARQKVSVIPPGAPYHEKRP